METLTLVSSFPDLASSLSRMEGQIKGLLLLLHPPEPQGSTTTTNDGPLSPTSLELLRAMAAFSSFLRDLFVRAEAAFSIKLEAPDHDVEEEGECSFIQMGGEGEEEDEEDLAAGDDGDTSSDTDGGFSNPDPDDLDLPIIYPENADIRKEEEEEGSEDSYTPDDEDAVEDSSEESGKEEEDSDSDPEYQDLPSPANTRRSTRSKSSKGGNGPRSKSNQNNPWPPPTKDSSGSYPCLHPTCDHKSKDRSLFRHHMQSRHADFLLSQYGISSPKHPCPKCGKCFISKSRMTCHLARHDKPSKIRKPIPWPSIPVDTTTGLFPCIFPSCGAKGRSLHVTRNHMHLKHAEFLLEEYGLQLPKFECSKCGRTFIAAALLAHHERQHEPERPFLCSECGLSFKMQGNLNRHIKDAHSGEKILCPDCGKECKTAACLAVHKLAFHTKEEERRRWLCSECGAKLASNYGLKLHMISVHSDLRAFPCPNCDSSFKNPGNLRRHVKSFCSGGGQGAGSKVSAKRRSGRGKHEKSEDQ